MLLYTSPWLQWLLCVTMDLNWLITLHILLIWQHLFSVPQHEKTLGWEAVSDQWQGNICSGDLLGGSGWELLYHGNPSAATPMEELCGPQGSLCWKNYPHLVKFDHCIIVSLWAFQPTLISKLLVSTNNSSPLHRTTLLTRVKYTWEQRGIGSLIQWTCYLEYKEIT